MNFNRIAPLLFLLSLIPNLSAQAAGCLYTDDECKSSSWSHKLVGGKIIGHISVSGNVVTLTLKTMKRDAELNKGMLAALAKDFFCDASKIHEFDPDHEFIYHPTYSGNHIHYPLFRDLFPFLPSILNLFASRYAEETLNRFQVDHKIVEAIIRNVEPEIANDNVRSIISNFIEWERSRPAPQVFLSSIGSRVIRHWLHQKARPYAEGLVALCMATVVAAGGYGMVAALAQRRFATLWA